MGNNTESASCAAMPTWATTCQHGGKRLERCLCCMRNSSYNVICTAMTAMENNVIWAAWKIAVRTFFALQYQNGKKKTGSSSSVQYQLSEQTRSVTVVTIVASQCWIILIPIPISAQNIDSTWESLFVFFYWVRLRWKASQGEEGGGGGDMLIMKLIIMLKTTMK